MKPIFIGGCSRSGTTLLGAMLGAHSKLLTTPESQFKTDVYLSMKHPDAEIESALDKITRHHRFRHWALPLKDRQKIIRLSQSSYARLILALVEVYEKSKLNQSAGRLWVDHTPSNIRHAHLLSELFPRLKMIHIVRDGRAVAASILPLDWGPNSVISAAHFWLENIAFGLAAERYLGSTRIFRINYEKLVSDPMEAMKAICKFIDIPFEKSTIRGGGFSPPAYTNTQHRLVGKPPEASVAHKWERQLTSRQIRAFEGVTADMLRYLGYARKYKGKAVTPNVAARLTSDLWELFRGYLINKLKHQYRRLR